MAAKEKILKGFKNPKKAVGRVSHLPGELVETQVFKTQVGLGNHIKGKRNIRSARSASDITRETEDRGVAENLRSRGIAELGQPYEDSLLEDIQTKVNELVEDDETSYVRASHDGDVFSRAIFRVHERIPELAELLTEDMVEQLQNYYGSHISVTSVYYWRNYHVPDEILESKKEIFSDRWHPDIRPIDTTKLFVNISDVTEEHGPFHILPLTQSRQLAKQRAGRFLPEHLDQFVDPDHVIKATGPAGTALLCNTELCWHRAGIPAPGNHRDIVQFQFKPSDEPLADNWIEDIEMKEFERRKIEERRD